ncbi:MAG: right-handed parallel beta-helix repeat-containing protein [Planctomycetota bacterium]|jgi:hypothetical protein
MKLACSLMTALFATTAALGETWNVPSDFQTIQAAIDAAGNGDEIMVADGTYTGDGNRDLDFGGTEITLRSANGAAVCVIDVQGSSLETHRAFWFYNNETSACVVEGFTIQGGYMDRGGAVLCELGSAPSFQSCVFRQNTAWTDSAEDGGGAVYNHGSSPTFTDCEFTQNHVEANHLFAGGGAVHNQSDSSPTFVGCTFDGNTASGPEQSDGGAVSVWDGGHPEFYSCTFIANQAYWDAAVLNFSGITMHDCVFQDNQTIGAAGGAYGQYGGVWGGGSAELVNCSFIGNSTGGNSGGAVVVQHPGASAIVTNCLFAGNEAAGRGGGLWVGNDAEVVVTNCTFSGNIANAGDGGGGLSVRNGAIAAVDNCILWDNAPNQIHLFNAGLTVTYTDVEGGWPGVGNTNADPLFVDAAMHDFRLGAGSPCIDAGDNAAVPVGITVDIDGNPRFTDDTCKADTGSPPDDAPYVDMGAYEFQACSCDLNGDGSVGVNDFLLLLSSWGPCADCDNCSADFDGDCEVGVTDFLKLLACWG